MKKATLIFALIVTLHIQGMGIGSLKNDKIIAGFNEKGLVSVYDKGMKEYVHFENDNAQLMIDSQLIDLNKMAPSNQSTGSQSLSYFYSDGAFNIEIRYELKPGWRFVSKQIFVTSLTRNAFVVNKIEPFSSKLKNEIKDQLSLSNNRYGVALRLRVYENGKSGYGCFMAVQNPFTRYAVAQNSVTIEYTPDMKWEKKYGPFPSDRLCIGFTELTGATSRVSLLPEWNYVEDPAVFLGEGVHIDRGEIEALTQCMRAFLLVDPQESARVHIGWCENDYQIDVSTESGNREYKRIIDQAAALGCQHVLYTPANYPVAPLSQNRDAWGWENVLWFNMGQKIRNDEWKPGDPLPETVQDIVDYAKSKKIGLMSYVYPSMPFLQNPEWTAWRVTNNKRPSGYTTVDTGLRSYQDWLVERLIEFAKETGCTGFSFDHWWIAYKNDPEDKNVMVSSAYQQWFGCRRVLELLRERAPWLVVDGRQQYHSFGTWTWLAGTYPHPMMSDEQPGSFNAIPDLSTDRVNGARQRFIAYRLMTNDFVPVEILPGFITHQTQRSDAQNVMHRDSFRIRDWDYLGWKYNLLSSISTAPFNHVVNYIPARDINEFNAFSERDKAFFNYWLDFTDKNAAYMRNVRPILGQPMVGKCDGTSAIVDDNGYIFLFNPNYRELTATITLDKSIGLMSGKSFIIREIYPVEGVMVKGILSYGEKVEIGMPGIGAKVFRIEPAGPVKEPMIVNSVGKAVLQSKKLVLTEVEGIVGSVKSVSVILPGSKPISEVLVNGVSVGFSQSENLVTCEVPFRGDYFPRAYSLVEYYRSFNGETVEATLVIPERIFSQLEERKKVWPVSYSDDDKIAPWLDPSRLLLYVQVSQPYRATEVQQDARLVIRQLPIRKSEYTVEIDGRQVELNEGYNGVYPTVERSNLGIFVDISNLEPGVPHKIRVKLPAGLNGGQFQGLFIDHVEDEYTREIGR